MSSIALLKYKASKCGELLAQSFLSEGIKDVIIENIGNATEEDLDNLLKSLEREQIELEKIEKEMIALEKEESIEWDQLKKRQEEAAEKLISEFLADFTKPKI